MSSLKLTEQQLREFLFQTFSQEFENKNVQENKKNIKIKTNTNRKKPLLKEGGDPPTPTLDKSYIDNQSGNDLSHDFRKVLNFEGKEALGTSLEQIKSLSKRSAVVTKSNLSKEKIGAMILAQITKEHSDTLFGWNPDTSFFDFWLKETFTKDELGLKDNETLEAEEYILRNVPNSAEVNIVTQFGDLQPVIDISTMAFEPGYFAYQKFVRKTELLKIKPTNIWLTLIDAALSIASAYNRSNRLDNLRQANQGQGRFIKSREDESLFQNPSQNTNSDNNLNQPQKTQKINYFENSEIAGTLDDVIWWEEIFWWLDLLGAVPLIGSIFGYIGVTLRKKGILSGTAGKTTIKKPRIIRYTKNGKGIELKKFADLETDFFTKYNGYTPAKKSAEAAGFNLNDKGELIETSDMIQLFNSNPILAKLHKVGFDKGHAILLYYSNPELFKNLDALNLQPHQIYAIFNTILLNKDVSAFNTYYTKNTELTKIRNQIMGKEPFEKAADQYDQLDDGQKKLLFFQAILQHEKELAKKANKIADAGNNSDAAVIKATEQVKEASLLKNGFFETLIDTADTSASHMNEILKNASDEAFTTIQIANIKNNALLSFASNSINNEIIEIIGKLGDEQFLEVFNKIFPPFDELNINNLDTYLEKIKAFEDVLSSLGMKTEKAKITEITTKINQIKNQIDTISNVETQQITKQTQKIPSLNDIFINKKIDVVKVEELSNNFNDLIKKIPSPSENNKFIIYDINNPEKTIEFQNIDELTNKISEMFEQLKASKDSDNVDNKNIINGLNNIWYSLSGDHTTYVDSLKKVDAARQQVETQKSELLNKSSAQIKELQELYAAISNKLNAQRPKQSEFFAQDLSKNLPNKSGKTNLESTIDESDSGPQEKYYDLSDPEQVKRYKIDKALWESLSTATENNNYDNFINTYINVKYSVNLKSVDDKIDDLKLKRLSSETQFTSILNDDEKKVFKFGTTFQRLKLKSKAELVLPDSEKEILSNLTKYFANDNNLKSFQQIEKKISDFNDGINKQIDKLKKEKQDQIHGYIQEDAELKEIMAVVSRGRGKEYVFRRVNYNFVNRLDKIRTNISKATKQSKEQQDVSQRCFEFYSEEAVQVAQANDKKSQNVINNLFGFQSQTGDSAGQVAADASKSGSQKNLEVARRTAETEKYLQYIMNGYINIDEKQTLDFLKLMKASMTLNINSILLILNPDTVKSKEFVERMLKGDNALDSIGTDKETGDDVFQKLIEKVDDEEVLKKTLDMATGSDELINKIPEIMLTINKKMLDSNSEATNYLKDWRLTKAVWKSASESLEKSILSLKATQKRLVNDLATLSEEIRRLKSSNITSQDAQARLAMLELTQKIYQELLNNINLCFTDLSASIAGNGGLDILGNLSKYTKVENTSAYTEEALNKESVIKDFLVEFSSPEAIYFNRSISWMQSIYNFWARCRSLFQETLFGQDVKLIMQNVTADTGWWDSTINKFDEIPDFVDSVSSNGIGVQSFIEKLGSFRKSLLVDPLPKEQSYWNPKNWWHGLKFILEFCLIKIPLAPINFFIKHPTMTFIAFKALSYASVLSGASSIFFVQTILLFGLKMLNALASGVGFKFLMWCITSKSKNVMNASKSFVTDILSVTNKLLKICLKLSVTHARVRNEADKVQTLQELENSWSPEGIINRLFFWTLSKASGSGAGTIKDYYVKQIATQQKLDDIKNSSQSPNIKTKQSNNSELRILETDYARNFQNNFDRFIKLIQSEVYSNSFKEKNSQYGDIGNPNIARDEKLSLRNLSRNAAQKLMKNYQSFSTALDESITDEKEKSNLNVTKPILYYFYLTDLLKKSGNNVPANRNNFIVHEFSNDHAELRNKKISSIFPHSNQKDTTSIQIDESASLYFSNIISVKNASRSKNINGLNSIKQFFIDADLIDVDVVEGNLKQIVVADISIYDCQIILKFLHDIQVEKKNLINRRKKTNFNKEGHLNLEAMLTGGLYNVTFTSEIINKNGQNANDGVKKKISIQTAAVNDDYKPKEYKYFDKDNQEQKMTLSYLRQFSESAPGTAASQLSEDLWVSNWQPKKNSLITGFIPDMSTLTTIKQGLLSVAKVYARLTTAVLDSDINVINNSSAGFDFDVGYLLTGEPPTNFINRYKALTFIINNRDPNNNNKNGSNFATLDALKLNLKEKIKAGEISEDLYSLIIELWTAETTGLNNQSKKLEHYGELNRLKELNKEGLVDDWNVEAIENTEGKDIHYENFDYKLSFKNGKKVLVEWEGGGGELYGDSEDLELKNIRVLNQPYEKAVMNNLKLDLMNFNTARKGTIVSDDVNNKDVFNADLTRATEELNSKNVRKNLEASFANYKNKLKSEVEKQDRESALILKELEQFRNYTVDEIMKNPGLIDQMHQNALKQIQRIETDAYASDDIKKYDKLNFIREFYLTKIVPKLEATQQLAKNYQENMIKLKEAVEKSKGKQVEVLMNNINLLSINIAKQGICLGKPRSSISLQEILKDSKFKTDLTLNDKLSLFKNDTTKLLLCMQAKEQVGLDLNDIEKNIDALSTNLKSSQSNLLFSVIARAIQEINKKSIDILNSLSSQKTTAPLTLCDLEPVYYLNNDEASKVLMNPINKNDVMLLNNIQDNQLQSIAKRYAVTDFVDVNYTFLKNNFPKNIDNGKSVKDIYSAIFVEMEAINVDAGQNDDPTVDETTIKNITNDYVDLILKPVFGDAAGADFVLDSRKHENDNIIGFYYNKESMLASLEKVKSNLKENDYKQFKEVIEADAFFINRIIYSSNVGMQQIGFEQGNKYLEKMEYIYEVDISSFYFMTFTKEQTPLNTNNGEKQKKIYEYYGIPYLDKNSFSTESVKKVVDIIDPTDNTSKKFDASYTKFKYKSSSLFNVFTYSELRRRYGNVLIQGKSIGNLKNLSFKQYNQIFSK